MFSDKTNTTVTTTTKAPLPSSERKKAVCFGINDYPGDQNDLSGCVNDAKEWSALLSGTYGFKVQTFLDKNATAKNLIESLGDLILNSKSLDHIVLTYSGHGTNVKDNNGDEEDGRDEALCLYDRFLIDDELRAMFIKLHPEARLTVISDSCFSGSVTRAFLKTMGMDKAPVPRYMPPKDIEDGLVAIARGTSGKILHPEEKMNEILISGCSSTEYSYDAKFGGKSMGAMSYYATNILKETPEITYDAFFLKLRQQLPSTRYPQSPCLEGQAEFRAEKMFI